MTTIIPNSPSVDNKGIALTKIKSSPKSLIENQDQWTTNRVIEELHYYLESLIDSEGNRRYAKQAKELIYRIPIYQPTPSFYIYRGDLTDRLEIELASYDEISRQDILKTAVGRLLENINFRYYIESVKRLLKVEVVD
jgi:hypothetical protein